ncbi:RDD family protein [Actinoallomurus rhizosphaericola]|uniref:RDD family protein n=1 Tax=Actinoallomurus rhizosphaericola TaxID=2952536 RepID=UPI0020932464|nr:RDD family protein [Actinoallomurus rhizosphaericola]MCO5996457.1 RDD family protein [Actinoallomurus rhizosphaericola]
MTERRRSIGSWIEGARAAGVDLGYPGERMGLPREGTGSAAGYGRRLGALVIDWLIALAVAAVLAGALHVGAQTRSLLTLLVFGVMVWLLTGSIGTTVGKRLCGLRVVRVDGGPIGPLWAFVRALLLVLVVPALIWDRDYRGLHDRAANSIVVRL